MKKNTWVLGLILLVSSLQADDLICSQQLYEPISFSKKLTTEQKRTISATVGSIIRKDRTKLVSLGVVVVGSVVTFMMRSIILPKIFEKETCVDFYISNPDDGKLLGVLNFGLKIFQKAAPTLLGSFLMSRIDPTINLGQWNFTLEEFIIKHTRIYEAFEQVHTQANTLEYEQDKELRATLIKSLMAKITLFMEYSYYVDGYVLLKINEFDKNSQFTAKNQLKKEYAIFETVRKNFIEELLSAIDVLKIETGSGDFQNSVLKVLQILRQGSRNLINSIQSMNFYEQGRPAL